MKCHSNAQVQDKLEGITYDTFPFVFQSTSQKMWTKIVQVDNEIIITFFIYKQLCPKDLKEN